MDREVITSSPATPMPDAAPTAPVLPGRWTVGRVVLTLLLAGHWLAVLAYAIPNRDAEVPLGSIGGAIGRESLPIGQWSKDALAFEAPVPIPILDTHPGKPLLSLEEDVSPLTLYLTLTNQSQRWKMFTPRRKMAAFLAVHYRMEDGSREFVRIADPERFSRPRWVRWRLLEWTLMSDHGIATHVPQCRRPLVDAFAPGRYSSANLRKHFCMLPVLRERELAPGVELFTSSEDFAALVRDPRKLPKATRPAGPIGPETTR